MINTTSEIISDDDASRVISDGNFCYIPPSIPANEKDREAEVLALNLIGTPAEERFDRFVRLTCRLFDVPISYISMIYKDQQYFKARQGIDMEGTSRQISLCGHALLRETPLIITDARKDLRFAGNPLVVGEPFVRFYAGQPLHGPNGFKIGTLCIIDRRPRAFAEKEKELLRELTSLVEHELALQGTIEAQKEAIRVKDELAQSQNQLAHTVEELKAIKRQTEELLHNILPAELVRELQTNGTVEPVRHEEVAVLFADFAGFTKVASGMEAKDLVEELNECFCHFDWVVATHRVEKLKTIGDGYLAVAGVPKSHPDDAINMLKAAIEIRDYMAERKAEHAEAGRPHWDVRIGLHLGPLVSGVVGVRKIAFDVWGDTVNTASRIESGGEPGRINVSGDFYERVKDQVIAVSRGKVHCKNRGEVEMYFIDGLKEDAKAG